MCESPDRADCFGRHRLDSEQRLMLPRLDSFLYGCAFAEVEKAANLVSEIGQFFVLRPRQACTRRATHIYIVLRYNCDPRIRPEAIARIRVLTALQFTR